MKITKAALATSKALKEAMINLDLGVNDVTQILALVFASHICTLRDFKNEGRVEFQDPQQAATEFKKIVREYLVLQGVVVNNQGGEDA